MPGVEDATAARPAPAPRRTGPGDAAFIGSWTAALPERVVDRHRADELASDVDLGQRAGRRTPFSRRRRASASHGSTSPPAPPAARRRTDHDVRGGQGVEAPDDLVAGRLREPERGDEGTDADHRAEDGQRDAGGPGHEARDRLRRPGRARASGVGVRLVLAALMPPRSSVRRPSIIRTRRRACAATWSSCVTSTSVRPASPRRRTRASTASVLAESRLPVGSSQSSSAVIAHQRAGDRDPLLLAARELGREEVRAVDASRRARAPQRRARARPSRGDSAVDLRQHHVLEHACGVRAG